MVIQILSYVGNVCGWNIVGIIFFFFFISDFIRNLLIGTQG